MHTTRRDALIGGTALAAGLALPGFARRAAAQAGTLTYIGWSHDEAASKPVLTELFDGYKAANPGVRFEAIGFPWAQMQQNLILRLRSNQPVDISQMAERWLPTFAQVGRPGDVDEIFGRAELEARIDPGLLRLGEWQGKRLGVPWTAASIGMVANRKVLSDAGLAEAPRTVDQFLQALRAVKRASPEAIPYAMMTKNNNSLSPEFQVWLWTFGGRLLTDDGRVAVDSDAGRRALSFMAELVSEGLAARDIDRPDSRRLFAQHRTAFYNDAPLARGFARDNSGEGRAFDRNVMAVATPTVEAGQAPKSLAWGHLLIFPGAAGRRVPADSPAARFVSHLALNDESQLKYFEAVGLFPVTKTALARIRDDAYVSDWTRHAASAEGDEPAKWPNQADIVTVVGEEVQAALLAQKPAAQAVADMAARLERSMRDVRRG